MENFFTLLTGKRQTRSPFSKLMKAMERLVWWAINQRSVLHRAISTSILPVIISWLPTRKAIRSLYLKSIMKPVYSATRDNESMLVIRFALSGSTKQLASLILFLNQKVTKARRTEEETDALLS